MTMEKSLGGMGFKDPIIFNNSLLANQCCKLVMEPNALWEKVMKGIYFHNKDFFKADKGDRA